MKDEARVIHTGIMLVKDVRCGDGEGVSSPEASRREGANGLGSEFDREDPRLPGDMNLATRSADPSFSHL